MKNVIFFGIILTVLRIDATKTSNTEVDHVHDNIGPVRDV